MTQQLAQEASTSFIRGLITEATELTFPKDASVDELNCTLERKGNRRRRLGIEYEAGYELTAETYTTGTPVRTLTWHSVGGVAGRDFSVVQIGNRLRFFDKSSTPVSANPIPISNTDSNPYILDLSTFNRPGGTGASTAFIQVASIQGALVVVSPEIEAFYIERDPDTEAFTTTFINHRIRDFEWLGNRAKYTASEDVDGVTIERQYDTLNAGWTTDTISEPSPILYDRNEILNDAIFRAGVSGTNAATLDAYIAATGSYPALTHPWFSGKDANDNFSVSEWQKIYTGTSLIGNGRFILDLFTKDRATASGLDLPSYVNTGQRFATVAAYAGRIFYAGLTAPKESSRVYFSRLLETLDNIGDCYQINDPTSEITPDLLDTDGGYINIPEALNVRALLVSGPFLLAFAENGVWSITGVDNDIFRATSYTVVKVTEYGIEEETSLVSANGIPFWWSTIGIHTITPTEFGNLEENSVSLNTIQTFWDDIATDAKQQVIGEYDGLNRRVLWMYPDEDETIDYKYNNLLFLDTELGAFFPWRVGDKDTDTPYIIGTSFFNGSGAVEQEFTVVDSDQNPVVDSSGNQVVVTRTGLSLSSSTIRFLVRDNTGSLTFATFTNTAFLDWDEVDYSSYAVSAHTFIGDLAVYKNAPYINLALERTETGWTGNDVDGYNYIRPSSILVSAYWDFKDSPSSSAQQGYRMKYTPTPPVFNHPYSVIQTRLRLRGRGKAMRLRFESETGKDFNLLGYEVIYARNPTI